MSAMRAEVVCVGTELLLGDIANTNAQEIGAMLAGIGVDCMIHTSVGDNEERIARAIGDALGRAGAVVVTGGLGPTQDDVTREAIAALTGRPLIRDPGLETALRAMFERLGRPMAAINLRQADRPEGSIPIDARIGTAPGLIVPHAGGVIYAIPGVPAEMREMMTRAVLPDLARRGGPPAAVVSRVVRIAGIAESAIAEALAGLWSSLEGSPVTMAYLAGGGEVRVRLTAKAATAAEAAGMMEPVEQTIRAALGPAVVGSGEETLEVAVGALLRATGATLAIAESLTGGLACSRMTRLPGSSDYFAGGVVTYSTESKTSLLGVDAALISTEGVVSEPVAAAMAFGVRARFAASIGLAYTGVAGPGAQDAVPAGTVCLAVDGPGGMATRSVRLPGGRETVRTLAAAAGLNMLRLSLLEVRTR